MQSYVWDTGALSLYFADHKKAVELMQKIESDFAIGYIPQIVYSEFYYKFWQLFGEQAALLNVLTLQESKLQEYILTQNDLLVVGKEKIQHNHLSLVDSIVVATARATHSTVITSDGDFARISRLKIVKLNF